MLAQPSLQQLHNPTVDEDDQPVADQVANQHQNDKKSYGDTFYASQCRRHQTITGPDANSRRNDPQRS
jgi:hypothetical protein